MATTGSGEAEICPGRLLFVDHGVGSKEWIENRFKRTDRNPFGTTTAAMNIGDSVQGTRSESTRAAVFDGWKSLERVTGESGEIEVADEPASERSEFQS